MQHLKDMALNAATAIVTIAAVVMVGIRVNQQFFSKPTGAPKPRRIVEWRDFAKSGQRIGPASAAVTIVEFTDFQCPFCRKAAGELRDIRRQFPGRVAIIFRYYPLPNHQFATASAQAAACAARQGAFETYQDLLFSSQDSIGRKAWTRFAEEAGVSDNAAFQACLSDPTIVALVKQDRAAGEKLGVIGTPTFLINDLEVSGYPGKGKLGELVRSALDAK